MGDEHAIAERAATWAIPRRWMGAAAGVLVVAGFTVVHDIVISDIWFNVGPMLLAGALCGFCLVWSYEAASAHHSTPAWWSHLALYAGELIVLGGVSIAVLRPQFTMGELMVADDAFERLLPPSMPLMIGAMVLGTLLFWVVSDRRRGAVLPTLVTQVLVVFLVGHQFAFLGLVESSSALLWIFLEFALFTVGLAVAFGLAVMWPTIALGHLRRTTTRR